jgi:amidophosphoribosyltransferase
LIASTSDLDQISEFIGADALIYQEIESLENAIGLKDLCLACLNGEYPTEHARRIRDRVAADGGSTKGRDYEREFSS